ncbi:type II toxin-antitoxin system HicB family antitoxin [Filimonas effusa]|uniref:Type II toxin-antitoxin system HicB family antitoxin n=1 Tax=Filimonas effusa TaxID=2508721 RepID=A0A4V1M9W1_9BACT|nr:type II toxin-antitoxin system HicB family antitoxin [Filimonas effusa]RXK83054.1 type II toxin-antitoxin system HicB family antitoxin [Filimonas effusa]
MTDTLIHNGYHGSVRYSSADEVFHGRIVGINDLVTFEGTNVAELKAAFKAAVADYLETCKALGKEPEKSYKGSFNIRIPAYLHKEAALWASINQISLNDFVRVAIDYTLRNKEAVAVLLHEQ